MLSAGQGNRRFQVDQGLQLPRPDRANESASGYYISSYQGDLLDKMVAQGSEFLNPAEQLTLIHDISSLATSGDLKVGRALDAAVHFANSPERQIVAQAENIVAGPKRFIPPALHDNYGRFVLKVFGARARSLGWSAKPGEDQETTLLRPNIVPFVARYDSTLAAEARKLADGWLENRKGVDANVVSPILSTAADFGDRALFDALVRELKKIQDVRQRGWIINALGSFRDPKLVTAALDLVIHSDIDARETAGLLYSGLGNPGTERMSFEFVKTNFDEILKRAPSGGGSDFGSYLPFSAGRFCDAKSEQEYIDFFGERAKTFTGGPRVYDQVLEGIRLCEAEKTAQSADITAYFAQQ